MNTTPIARRTFILDEGEQLLISEDALESAERFRDFLEETGLDPSEVVASPIVTIPMPVIHRGGRFPTVNPEALWLPLFWLPEAIGLRALIRENEGDEPRQETDTEWMIRVALELNESGLFHNGEWVDVFALYDIDATNPIDIARIEAWQAGMADDVLDNIDLTQHFTFSEDLSALYDAHELLPLLQTAQWCYIAASLISAIEEDPEHVATYVNLAGEMLTNEPSDAGKAVQEAALMLSLGEDIPTWAPKALDALNNIAEMYADSVYELQAA